MARPYRNWLPSQDETQGRAWRAAAMGRYARAARRRFRASRYGLRHGWLPSDALVEILVFSLGGMALSLFAIERFPLLVSMIAEMPGM
ncbi:MAG TPA: hypothetical protein VFA12_15615 [Stellaceae bacterium]|nr:hypothetical protein [Stellaceae bacterium]